MSGFIRVKCRTNSANPIKASWIVSCKIFVKYENEVDSIIHVLEQTLQILDQDILALTETKFKSYLYAPFRLCTSQFVSYIFWSSMICATYMYNLRMLNLQCAITISRHAVVQSQVSEFHQC